MNITQNTQSHKVALCKEYCSRFISKIFNLIDERDFTIKTDEDNSSVIAYNNFMQMHIDAIDNGEKLEIEISVPSTGRIYSAVAETTDSALGILQLVGNALKYNLKYNRVLA